MAHPNTGNDTPSPTVLHRQTHAPKPHHARGLTLHLFMKDRQIWQAATAWPGREKDMELTENTLWLLKQAFYFSLTTVNDAIRGHGVSTAQIGVLRQPSNEPGLSGAELARRLLISPQGVQLALTALEGRGFIERKPDPSHKRVLQAYLTESGLQGR